MRALTLTQPWAGLVASGIKLVENRPRSMIKGEDFGKPFAIHASRVIDESVYARIMDIDHDNAITKLDYSDGMIVQVIPIDARWYKLSRITSAVIGVATLVDAMYIGGCNEAAIARAVERAGLPPNQLRWT